MTWEQQRRAVDARIASSEVARAADEARKPAREPDAYCLREECRAAIGPAMQARPQLFGVLALRIGEVTGWVCGQECRRRIDWRLRSTGQPQSVLLTGTEPLAPAHVRQPMRVAVGPEIPSTPATEPPGSTRRVVARCTRNGCNGETAIEQVVSTEGLWSPDAAKLLRLANWVTDPEDGELYCSHHCLTWVATMRARGTHPRDHVAVDRINDVSYQTTRTIARSRAGLPASFAQPPAGEAVSLDDVTPAMVPVTSSAPPAAEPAAASPKPPKRSR